MDLAKDLHLVVIPLLKGSKRPFLRDWQKWTHEKSYQFFEKPRDLNRGILCGPISDLTVIDVEVDQMEHWNRFLNGEELKTLTVNTGGGGKHYYFKYFHSVNLIKHKLPTGGTFDLKTTGGQVVWIDSVHPNGTKYTLNGECRSIAEAPSWIKQIVC